MASENLRTVMTTQEPEKNPLLQAALAYTQRGWQVLPLQPGGKAPLGKLVPHGLRDATTDQKQISQWWEEEPQANVGIRTGIESDLVVLDIDPQHEGEEHLLELEKQYGKLPDTVTVLTGGGGQHLYFSHPGPNVHIKSRVGIQGFRGVDVRGDGGYVAAPPSLHKSGRLYAWEVSSHPEDVALAPFPEFLHAGLSRKTTPLPDSCKALEPGLKRYSEGERNVGLTSLAGSMRHRGMGEEAILAALRIENGKRCDPPLSDEEVCQIAKSVARYVPSASQSEDRGKTTSAQKEGKSTSQISRLTQLCEEAGVLLFHDQFKSGFARVPNKRSYEVYRLKSSDFLKWLAYQLWQADRTSPSSDTLQRVLNTLESRASFDGEQRTLWNRVARLDGTIWYDLGQGAVHITPNHWEIVPDPPILFYRYSHQRQQVYPVPGGSILGLLPSLNLPNIAGTLSSTPLLTVVYLVTLLIPEIPHPILAVQGDQGSGKTTLFKIIRDLIDPSETPTLGPQDSLREFVQLASHHWLVWLDNLTKLPDWLSDAMCRCVTGEGFSKRELFSDDDDKLYSYRRCLGFNGINLIASKPDLLDRSLIISLERIPDTLRQTEEEFWQTFGINRPKFLGALFTLLSQAMGYFGAVSATRYPRMADFARWGEAITLALNLPPQTFREAWEENQRTQTRETLEASPVAQALLKFTESRTQWEGSPKELLEELNQVASDVGVDTKSPLWPKDIRWIWRRIKEVRPNLQAEGVQISRSREGDQTRIRITRTSSENDSDVSVSPNLFS